jgi:DNA-binding MarR family transcriptional regulator
MSAETKLDTAEAIRIAAFRAVIRSFLRTSERLAKEANLTPRRYLLLLMIKGAPDGSEQSTVTDLAARLQLAQSTVTELVGRAERAGLLERERSEKDLRVAHLRLTDEGERRLALAARSLAEQRHDLRRRLEELDDD